MDTILHITYAMCSTSIFTCLMTIVSGFTKFVFFVYLSSNFLFTNIITDFCFLYDFSFLIFNKFLKLVIFNVCSLKDSQNFFMKSLPLYLSSLFSTSSNNYIVGTEKPDRICSLTFVLDNISRLFLHPSIYSIKYSRSA